jgi:hypothetical protein
VAVSKHVLLLPSGIFISVPCLNFVHCAGVES